MGVFHGFGSEYLLALSAIAEDLSRGERKRVTENDIAAYEADGRSARAARYLNGTVSPFEARDLSCGAVAVSSAKRERIDRKGCQEEAIQKNSFNFKSQQESKLVYHINVFVIKESSRSYPSLKSQTKNSIR